MSSEMGRERTGGAEEGGSDVADKPRTDLDIPGETVAGGPTGTEDFDTFGSTEAGASEREQPPEGNQQGE